MLIHRDGWRYSGRVPEFFPGSCGACCGSTSYHIRQYENDSGMALIEVQSDNRTAQGLQFDGTYITAIYNSGSSSPFIRGITYDDTMDTVLQVTHSYDAFDEFNPNVLGSVFLCGDGKYAVTATRTTASTGTAIASINADNTLNWEKNLDSSGGIYDSASCVVGDSSGNVYVAGTNYSLSGTHITKYNSSGTKQWRTAIAVNTTVRLITIASDGYIWMSDNAGRLNRCDTSGTVTNVLSLGFGNDFSGNLTNDGSGGVWVGMETTSPSYTIRNYDSTGTLVTTITDSRLAGAGSTSRIRFDVDSSGNIYGLLKEPSGGAWKVGKWDSSGASQWVSGDIGWLSSSSGPRDIAVSDSYIWVGGSWVS